MSSSQPVYDALVVGGGPGGATAALAMARAGLSVRLCERVRFPRFHIGESFLPRNFELICELGLEERLRALPHVEKRGAEFAFGHGRDWQLFPFTGGLVGDPDEAFSTERAAFDAMLLEEARAAGVEVDEGAGVRSIVRLADGDVRVTTDKDEEIAARVLIDCSGQATLVGKHLGTREVLSDLKKVAYWGHFEGVERRPGVEGGYTRIVMCDEGWFWVIPVSAERDSIGLVMDAAESRRVGLPPQQMLAWAVARCPMMKQLTANARHPGDNLICADFSYRCRPFSGPGYFLVGDAATFIDPIFSTGACMAMMSAMEVARGVTRMLRHGAAPEPLRRSYNRFVEESSTPFFRMVRGYYQHSFRELFVNGTGPLQVHKAALSVLAGSVFPRPVWALRWRLWLLFLFVRLNRHLPLVKRRDHFSLFGPEAEATAADRSRSPA